MEFRISENDINLLIIEIGHHELISECSKTFIFKALQEGNMAGQTAGAVQTRRVIGADTDWELYELVDERPGLSIYELAKLKGWTHGRVHGAVKRLEKSGLVRTELVVEGSRAKSLVRPLEWWEMMTPEELDELKKI